MDVDPKSVPPGTKEHCPGCGVDLRYERNGTVYNRGTSVEVRGVYDGGLFYAHTVDSGGCGIAWHRWGTGDASSKRLHDKAEQYIDMWNERWYESS